jgi:non-ribosomal peptide synthetase component E (peptide arylation enzyme)
MTLFNMDRFKEHYRSGFWRDDTVYALVQAHAQRAPNRIAIRSAHGDLSYRVLVAHADAFASELASKGVIAGQRIAVWLPSRAETAIALLACSRNGYVCCPSLHRDHTISDILALLERVRAVAIIVEAGYGADDATNDLCARLSEAKSV